MNKKTISNEEWKAILKEARKCNRFYGTLMAKFKKTSIFRKNDIKKIGKNYFIVFKNSQGKFIGFYKGKLSAPCNDSRSAKLDWFQQHYF